MNSACFARRPHPSFAVLFILAGFGKLTDISGTFCRLFREPRQDLPGVGPQAPPAVLFIAGLIELLGGLAVLIGFQTRIAAWVMAAFLRRHRAADRPYRRERATL